MTDNVVWCDRGLFPVKYCFCPNEKAWKRLLKKMNVRQDIPYPTVAGRCTSFTSAGQQPICVVTMGKCSDGSEPSVIQVAGIITHEATHVWQEVREQMNEHSPSKEFEAYSLQFIATELLYAYRNATGDQRFAHVQTHAT